MTALNEVPGVETVQIDLATRWAVVRGPAVDVERIRAASAESGHPADL